MPVVPVSAEEPSRFAYAAGDLIAGKYELEALLGQGGMGAVFRARNVAIDLPVAIKLIRTDLNREQLGGRLLQEARAAAKISHPAIVRVFDVGQTALGDPFIVMELLQGESLAALMEREHRLTSPLAVQLLLPIADALSAAHAKGFVHRDVKPDNVFVADNDGQLQPKLVDFGIVKLEQRDRNSQLTQVGTVLGSPDYMSPEQARGLDEIDLRSDVWSFSVMLYEAIAGETPFSSDNYNALLRLIVEKEPTTLHELRVADAQLSAIVARGMAKDPARRFQSMGQLGRALAEWLFRQGLTQDACGVSLEAKWLNRDSQSGPGGRASRSSIPDSWPAPPSGVRAVQGNRNLGTAPTIQASSQAGTPISLAPVERRLERKLYGGIALALLLAAGLAWAAFAGTAAERATRGSAAAGPRLTLPTAEPIAPIVPVAEPASPSLTPVEASSAAAVEAPAKRPASKAATSPNLKPSSPAAAAAQSKPEKAEKPVKPTQAPGSDLLAPY